MESLREILQEYSGSNLTLGSKKGGAIATRNTETAAAGQRQSVEVAAGINRVALQQSLESLSKKNEKYFIIGIGMAVALFIVLIIAAFMQIGQADAAKAIPPIFGSSAAVVVWKTFRIWREKNYTDCVLALVPNVDEETLKAIVGVLVKKI